MNLNKQLEIALEAISLASKAVLEIYHSNFQVNIKKDHSEVTNADLTSEKIIKDILHKNFPEYAILAEESGDDLTRLDNDYCWIIDPLDGTKDFVNKTNNFAINIALAYQHEIVLGVISVPCFNIIYYATLGNGAYKIENNQVFKINVSNRIDHLKMVTSYFFFKDNDLYENNPLIKEIKAIGSSYKAGLIAEGKADLCIKNDPHTKEWDTAPSEIIVSEAGGLMSDIYGHHRSYNKKDIYNHTGFLITNNKINQERFKQNEKETEI